MENKMHKPTLRVLNVLELVASSESGYRLSEIARQLDMSPGTLYPILQTLKNRKYLSCDETSQLYRMGMRIFGMGNRFADNSNPFNGVMNILTDIVQCCGETCHFGILDGPAVLYVAKVDSAEPIRMHSSIGKKLPAYGTAIGKALLRDYSFEELQNLYSEGLVKLTENTITDLKVLYNQIVEVRKTGYAYEREESNEMITCIAKPVCVGGRTAAAISVAIPVFRYSEEKKVLVEKILDENVVDLERLMPYIN